MEVEKLCQQLMHRISRVIPVIPMPMLAAVFLRNPGVWLSMLDVKVQVYRLIDELQSCGATITVPEKDRETAVERGLNMMRLRRMVVEKDDRFRANPGMNDILSYYANTLTHWNGNLETQLKNVMNKT